MMPTLRIALVLGLATTALAGAKSPKPPDVGVLIDRAEAAIASGVVDPERDLAPLVARLAATQVEREQDSLVREIDTLGRHDGRSPAAVKAYLRAAAPPVLLAVARGSGDAQMRGNALLALRSLDVDDATLDEGIAIGAAATEHAVQFSGRLLADWKDRRSPPQELRVAETPEGTAGERAALALIEKRHVSVGPYSLGRAASEADVALVKALLDAGVDVNSSLVAGSTPLAEAAGSGCAGLAKAPLADRLATIDLLISRGAKVDWRDAGGNTLLIGAVHCPLPVMEKLLAAGADPTAVGKTAFSPLQFALANARWDLAELLVAHGARLTKEQVDQLFFEKPSDPAKLALLRRATAQ